MTTKALLSKVTVEELVTSKTQTYCIGVGDTLRNAMDMMKKFNILSLPVTDANGKIEGMISVMDLLVYLAWAPYFETGKPISGELSQTKLETTVRALLGLTEESRTVHVVEPHLPLMNLAIPFTSGLHRVLVQKKIGEDQTAIRVLSQSDVIRFIYERKSDFVTHMEKKLKDLVTPKKVISINESFSALDGFKEMTLAKVPAVAVVDSQTGEVIGNLAASDLRGVSSEALSDVILPVMSFLKKTRGHAFKILTVTIDNTLEDAIKMIVENKVHRLWLVAGDQNKEYPMTPIGILTLTDIFKTFFPVQS